MKQKAITLLVNGAIAQWDMVMPWSVEDHKQWKLKTWCKIPRGFPNQEAHPKRNS